MIFQICGHKAIRSPARIRWSSIASPAPLARDTVDRMVTGWTFRNDQHRMAPWKPRRQRRSCTSFLNRWASASRRRSRNASRISGRMLACNRASTNWRTRRRRAIWPNRNGWNTSSTSGSLNSSRSSKSRLATCLTAARNGRAVKIEADGHTFYLFSQQAYDALEKVDDHVMAKE